VKGPEDETRTVDKEEMIAFFHGSMDSAAALQGPYKLGCAKRFRLTKLLLICNRWFFLFPLKNHILHHKSKSPAFDRAAGLIAGLSPARVRLGQRPHPPLRAFVLTFKPPWPSSRPWRLCFLCNSLQHSKFENFVPIF
jgi:hypothetical protein